MQTVNIHLKHLQNEEHFMYIASFTELAREFSPEQLNIVEKFALLIKYFELEITAMNKVTKSALTPLIAEADIERCSTFRGMADTVKGALNHFMPEVREAAKQLKIVVDTHGNMLRKSMIKRTAALTGLLSDLSNTYAEDVKTAGIEEWVKVLGQQNIEFVRLTNVRDDEVASRTDIVLEDARAQVDTVYGEIIERIRALKLLETDKEIYGDFLHRLGVVIAKYNSAIAQRQSRGKKQPAAPQPPAANSDDMSAEVEVDND